MIESASVCYPKHTLVGWSDTDERKHTAIPARRSTWREVLGRRDATGTRVDVSTGQQIETIRGTGELKARE